MQLHLFTVGGKRALPATTAGGLALPRQLSAGRNDDDRWLEIAAVTNCSDCLRARMANTSLKVAPFGRWTPQKRGAL